MSIRWPMGMMLLWVLATVICCVGEGIYLGEGAVDQINDITGFSYLESQGILGLPMMGATFFINLPKLLSFDYAFFEGGAGVQIIRLLFMATSAGFVWGLLQVFLPAAQGLLQKLFKL